MSNRTITRLLKEYEAIQKNPIPNALVVPESENWLIWHYVIYNLEGVFSQGVYYGELRFPSNYPMGPPSIIMHTPSGRFIPGAKICVSMSSFHPETWTPSWNINTIILAIISFMHEDDHGVGSVTSTSEEKVQFALSSFLSNRKNSKFLKHFEDYLEVLSPAGILIALPQPSQNFQCRQIVIWGISFTIPILLFTSLYAYYIFN